MALLGTCGRASRTRFRLLVRKRRHIMDLLEGKCKASARGYPQAASSGGGREQGDVKRQNCVHRSQYLSWSKTSPAVINELVRNQLGV